MKTVTRTILSLVVVIFCAMITQAQIVDTAIMLKDAINIDSLNRLSTGNEEKRKYFTDCEPHPNPSFIGTDTAYFTMHQGEIKVFLKYENGKKIKAIGYFDNGNKYWEANFNGETLHGLDIIYFKNGHKEYQRYYENGKQIYPEIVWYESGNLLAIEDKNERTGKHTINRWYENGRIKAKIIGLDSLKSPEAGGAYSEKLYHENGNILGEAIYNAGVQTLVNHYENGQKVWEGKILDWAGYQLGKWKEWHENGQLKREYSFSDSIPNHREGVWKWWDEEGNLVKQEIYKDNELVEVKETSLEIKLKKE